MTLLIITYALHEPIDEHVMIIDCVYCFVVYIRFYLLFLYIRGLYLCFIEVAYLEIEAADLVVAIKGGSTSLKPHNTKVIAFIHCESNQCFVIC